MDTINEQTLAAFVNKNTFSDWEGKKTRRNHPRMARSSEHSG
jgi:hypothetical protein